MYEKILVPLDGSEVGEAAISDIEDLALKMIRETPVELTLLRVISPSTYDFAPEDWGIEIPYTEKEMEQIKKKVQQYLDEIAKNMKSKGIKVKTMVTTGNAAEEILKAAQKTKANLIAMSTHGRSGLGRWALGSVTDKVLHHSDIPVLTVRAKHKKANP